MAATRKRLQPRLLPGDPRSGSAADQSWGRGRTGGSRLRRPERPMRGGRGRGHGGGGANGGFRCPVAGRGWG
ncbi:hypothetical protein chiPu_0017533 [Chiloscyllium punctatum]|uniref:Uncharacterized protein n=1 Tax=Chiloscyllium punctatum TaxID=137246 RepID=A0A401RGT8_CHIPU|nr:hypothetical protein [Chiloscyllium punctatum]